MGEGIYGNYGKSSHIPYRISHRRRKGNHVRTSRLPPTPCRHVLIPETIADPAQKPRRSYSLLSTCPLDDRNRMPALPFRHPVEPIALPANSRFQAPRELLREAMHRP
jgi:hypothetical protein